MREQTPSPPASNRRSPLTLAAVAAAVAVLICAAAWMALKWRPGGATSSDREEAPKTRSPDRPLVVMDDGYVGSASCRECHPSEHGAWHASFHRTMTQPASPESILGDFDDVVLEYGDRRYHLARTGDRFFVETQRQGKTLTRDVVLCTGSHHMQVYWMPSGRGRELEILPFTYLLPERKWVPRSATFLGLPDDEPLVGRWNRTCIACHATHGVPGQQLVAMKTTVAEFGISCEACHGPAAEHVARARSSAEGAARAIVNPARLSPRRASQVCSQCHGVINDFPGDYERFLVHGVEYRPGEEMSNYRKHFADPHNPTRFWPDGMARISSAEYNGLIESPCYQSGELSCLTCHRLHKSAGDPRSLDEWRDDQLAEGMRSNDACLKCHSEYAAAEKLTSHTHHLQASPGSECYNCHMPHTSYGLLKAIRSHQIDSPNLAASLRAGRPNACNLCHLDRTQQWTARHLSEWYGHSSPELTSEQRTVAAGVLWLLSGDAGQRALVAWSMGWGPAVATSGVDWLPPFLAQLFDDPYEVVRLIALRSLRSIPGYETTDFDVVAPPDLRKGVRDAVRRKWTERSSADAGDDRPELLIRGGALREDAIEALLQLRDDRHVQLAE